jgi:hypothetical protein
MLSELLSSTGEETCGTRDIKIIRRKWVNSENFGVGALDTIFWQVASRTA